MSLFRHCIVPILGIFPTGGYKHKVILSKHVIISSENIIFSLHNRMQSHLEGQQTGTSSKNLFSSNPSSIDEIDSDMLGSHSLGTSPFI